MQLRQLGQTGKTIGAVGLGCMSFGGIYGSTDEAESHRTLATALDVGVTHLDVADIYGMGVSESVIGSFIRKNGNGFTIATKAAVVTHPERDYRNDRAYLEAQLDGSLKRLGLDYVDLFYIHRRDPRHEVEDVMETMLSFKKAGKIGGIGFSEIAPSTLERALACGPVDAVQNEYSIWTRLPELGVTQKCAASGATFVSFSPLGRGALTDHPPEPSKFADGDFRKPNPRFVEPNWSYNQAKIARLRAYAHDHGLALESLAIAWVLKKAPGSIAIPGTRSASHLQACAKGGSVELSDQMMAEIEAITPAGFAHGPRYNEFQAYGPEVFC